MSKKSKMPTVYWITWLENGQENKLCVDDKITADREAAGIMMGTDIIPKIKEVTLQSDGSWK